MHRSLACGALGFISKSAELEEIFTAIGRVLGGDTYLPAAAATCKPVHAGVDEHAASIATLTPHQFRVFTLLREGLLNKQIAYELGVSEATIKAHVTSILRKLGVNNRTQAVILADRLALPAPAPGET
jgi:DNA-binding NarL/FixJ family response regulator